MFPTFISILDIQSWWEVPSIAHFCSLFRTAFNLLDFDIEDLEEALLTDGTEESSWLQDLIVRLLSGCLPNNEISTFNYQMFLRRLFRQKCQEHDRYNPFNTDIDFQLLPLRTKVDILHALCDFRLDADDVLDQLKNLEADSLRVEPLGFDSNDSAYWYFYGTRLYREDYTTKNNKKKAIWQVICFTEEDWFQLTKKLKKSANKAERQLHHTLNENFLPELPRLFKEKENLARKRLLENLPRRSSSRLKKLEIETEKGVLEKETQREDQLKIEQKLQEEEEKKKKKELENRRQEAYERRNKLKEERCENENLRESGDEMAGTRSKKSKNREKNIVKEEETSVKDVKSNKKRDKQNEEETKIHPSKPTTVGRQTNNSLSAATGQILIQPVRNTSKKKLKTSQIYRQTDEDLQTGMHKILDFVKNHEDAWPFTDPVEEEYAPNYYSIIRKPMDLQRMEERLESGYYKSFDKFRGDFQLIVDNCKLYNGAENEYTEMVDNLLHVFEKATEKYLDQISSSDDEIAIEFSNEDKKIKNKKMEVEQTSASRRKPMLVAQTDRKRVRSDSEDSLTSLRSRSYDSPYREVNTRLAKHRKIEPVEEIPEKPNKTSKIKKDKEDTKLKKEKDDCKIKEENEELKIKNKDKEYPKIKKDKEDSKKIKVHDKKSKTDITKKEKSISKKAMKNKLKKSSKKDKKKKVKTNVVSRSPSLSPPRSDSPPPSSPDSRFEYLPKTATKKIYQDALSDIENSMQEGKRSHFNELFQVPEGLDYHFDKKIKEDSISLSPKPKDKHNKLRETIEKLKAKSEIKLKNEFEFELDHPKENKDKFKKIEKEDKLKNKIKEKPPKSFKEFDFEFEEGNNTADSIHSDGLKRKRSVSTSSSNVFNKPPSSNMDALSIATEQTLKDINKWLDDTPKFAEFSSASNSPTYTGLDEIDPITAKLDQIPDKKEKPTLTVKKEVNKDVKKKPFRDPSKFFKRREIQRTIDRLQPGKSKGNLITNVQSTNKTDEIFPLGPLSKLKDTKNSLIVKTNTNAPKLSLGTVLDSFGKHKFVDDQKKEEEPTEEAQKEENPIDKDVKTDTDNIIDKKSEEDPAIKPHDIPSNTDDGGGGGATPNLSAWFKAFGAPKIQPAPKKNESKTEEKEDKIDSKKIIAPLASPNTDVHVQPITRQRRISTGSSISERSSFSQDMDSPRVGMDERGAYPAPYPSPLHRSPSGASPIMASPRPDISPKTAYSTINGQIRVGFYQDTVSNKSSPDKSCSPKENSQSPYPHYSEHVYTPNTTENTYYSYANSPYYTHVPNYSSTNPTPPYNAEGNYSYYDNNKSQNYTANSPASNQSSPHPHQSPNMNADRSPGVHSPVYSPHSPTILPQHSPNVHPQQSPVVHPQHSPGIHQQHSPGARTQRPPSALSANSPDVENYPNQDEQKTVFPVKKRAYNESEIPQISNQKFEIDPRLTQQIEMKKNLENHQTKEKIEVTTKGYVHQNIPDPKSLNIPTAEEFFNNKISSQTSSSSFNYNSETNYQLNIPSRDVGQQNKIDMSKYTNMGYTGPDVNTRLQQLNFPTTSIPSTLSQKRTSSPMTTSGVNANEVSMRYGNPNLALQQIGYKAVDAANVQQSRNNYDTSDQSNSRAETINDRLSQMQAVSSASMSRSNYNTSSVDVGRTMANLSHIVDRFSNDDRMMVGLQNTSSFYSDKPLGTSHILNKPISNNASALPIFSQANMAAIQSYNQNLQATTSSLYNRQMTDLQNSGVMQSEMKNSQQQMQIQEKKSKKRKTSKNVATSSSESHQQTSTNQGFQSYAGLKGNASLEPSAISLKTSSVVPGSAFNFGPTPTGLGIGSGLYADKDAYPNFLEEFRSAPNYYMAAAAAAHHRSTPENADKQTRPAHQNSNPQSYPFLGAPQARSTYPIAGPFLPNAQAQLMDTSSPLYQHYLQAGVLNQGLLPPPGAYPPGYHPALSMRQPYDSMNRPPWL
ncbi:uncharacterized protein LOC130448611 [Diorhabda sublineata]|uniref:uncharacterized protein LOC130448611 n=1 Tax=Diorhabda sublineata TaxID=1163346 RepID=UPI0024E12BCC|nr:uncharacterized protein LOC130448611 [Diorhabda sublineata]